MDFDNTTEVKDLYLSDDVMLAAQAKEYVDGNIDALSAEVSAQLEPCVRNDRDETLSGHVTLAGGLAIGDSVIDFANDCIAAGNQLTVGSYNFFWKGLDLSSDGKALIYLCHEQPRYPFPFVTFNNARTKFKIVAQDVDVDDASTIKNLSADNYDSFLPQIFMCQLVADDSALDTKYFTYRPDYNQLSIDLGPKYWENPGVPGIQDALRRYLREAFTEDQDVTQILAQCSVVGQTITLVNSEKIAFTRCGTILEVVDGSAVLVQLNDVAVNDPHALKKMGSQGFSDFDYNDASFRFADSPTLSGPAKTSTFSCGAVGTANYVAGNGAFAAGKNLSADADFSVALGRRGFAKHYASFVWAPAAKKATQSTEPYTFNIGQVQALNVCHQPDYKNDIQIVDKDGNRERLYKYVFGCLSSDPEMKAAFKSWLGLA